MRDFFIGALEKLIAVVIVLMLLLVLIGGGAAMFGGGGLVQVPGAPSGGGGFVPGLIFLILGLIYVVFVGGFMYLGLGIYQNTKATAEAVKKMAGGA